MLIWFEPTISEELLLELSRNMISESDFKRARIEGQESETCRSIVFRMIFLSSVGSYLRK